MPKGIYKHNPRILSVRLKISKSTKGKNNHFWGKKHSPETLEKISGKNSNSWKGDKVGYFALHDWVRKQLGKPKKCEHCGISKAKKFEWANKSGEYKREIGDWIRLCTSCHLKYDYRLGRKKKGI